MCSPIFFLSKVYLLSCYYLSWIMHVSSSILRLPKAYVLLPKRQEINNSLSQTSTMYFMWYENSEMGKKSQTSTVAGYCESELLELLSVETFWRETICTAKTRAFYMLLVYFCYDFVLPKEISLLEGISELHQILNSWGKGKTRESKKKIKNCYKTKKKTKRDFFFLRNYNLVKKVETSSSRLEETPSLVMKYTVYIMVTFANSMK